MPAFNEARLGVKAMGLGTVTKRSRFLLSVLLLSVSFVPIFAVGGEAAPQRITVGVYPGGKNIWEYEADLSVSFNHVLQFQSVKQLNYAKIIAFLDRGYDVILNVEFTVLSRDLLDDSPSLDDLSHGRISLDKDLHGPVPPRVVD